jgi:glycosyltransferase involved in cell wall biosynthesis
MSASEVAIYCGPGWERFSADDIERRGLGGAETAAIRVASYLARDHGFAVTVYGEVADADARGVRFRDWRTFDASRRREAVIASRMPELADARLNAHVVMLWAHDLDFGDRLTPARAAAFDHVLCLSAWHRRHLAQMYPFAAGKLRRVRNGIDRDAFVGPVPKRACRVLSTSAPDRGLDILLELWPEIRARVAGAELAYAYAPVYERIADERPQLRAHLERVGELAVQDGVTALGALTQPQLAAVMRRSLVWAHPSFATLHGGPFHETSCISAMEAQAAGCVVVASDWGALAETVTVGRLVGGEPGSPEWRAALVGEIADALMNRETQAWAQREGPRAARHLGWRPVARDIACLVTGESVRPPTICLNMIVRNEAHIIRETLDSVAPYVDHVVAVDTGSSDATVETLRSWIAERGLPGEVHRRGWRNFGYNRSEALALAHGRADYIWVIDADDILVGELDLSDLRADAYLLRYHEEVTYWRKQIFRDGLRWRYEGVVHEYPVCDDVASEQRLPGDYRVVSRRLGARNLSPDKYQRDAALLRSEVERDSEDTRSVFYLAQSCFDAGDHEEARRWYARRAEMGGFTEEVFWSLMRCASCLALLGAPWEQTLGTYLEAYQARPVRAEPLYEIARHYRLSETFELGYLFAQLASQIPEPDDMLFVDTDVYAWKATDELAICAYYTGHPERCAALCEELLSSPALPDSERARVVANRDSCAPSAGRGGREANGGPTTLTALIKRLRLHELRLEIEPDWPCTDASIAVTGDGLVAIVRTWIASAPGPRYYLVALDDELNVRSVDPLGTDARFYDQLRLIGCASQLRAIGLERTTDGRFRAVLLQLDGSRIVAVSILSGDCDPASHAPFVADDDLRLIAGWSPTRVLDAGDMTLISERPAVPPADGFHSGSGGVALEAGWLFVVSDAGHHRFALLDRGHTLIAASQLFSIAGGSSESCWGLACRGDELMLAFGYEDRTVGLASLTVDDALALLVPTEASGTSRRNSP